MSCKSGLYTVNTSTQSVAVGGTIALGSAVRRFGCGANLNGNGINLTAAGYYAVDVSVTAQPTAAGTVTVSLYSNGVAVPGATASVTAAAGDAAVLSFPAMIRILCDGNASTLTLVLSGEASTVTNVATVVTKL